jgi:cytochrome c556
MSIRIGTVARGVVVVVLVAGGIACTPPARNFTDEQLRQVTSFQEIMWFLATQADPGFDYAKKADPAAVPPEKVAWLGEIGRKLRGAAPRLAEPAFSKGPDFNKQAAAFGDKAKALEAAAASKDGAKTVAATLDVKAACAACHTAFR